MKKHAYQMIKCVIIGLITKQLYQHQVWNFMMQKGKQTVHIVSVMSNINFSRKEFRYQVMLFQSSWISTFDNAMRLRNPRGKCRESLDAHQINRYNNKIGNHQKIFISFPQSWKYILLLKWESFYVYLTRNAFVFWN